MHIIYFFIYSILLMICFLNADDIYLKNGSIYKNVQVVDSNSLYITYKKGYTDELSRVMKNLVDEIKYQQFNPFIETECITAGKKIIINSNISSFKEYYKNPKYFPILYNGNLKFIDSTGQTVIKTNIKLNRSQITVKSLIRVHYIYYKDDIKFHDGLLSLDRGISRVPTKFAKNYQCIDSEGNKVFDIEAEWIGSFSDGLAQIKVPKFFLIFQTGYKYGYIYPNGTYHISPKYDYAGRFSEGLARIKVDNKFGYINKLGDIIIKPLFQEASEFSDSLAVVCFKGKFGYINKKGQLSIPAIFDRAWAFNCGRARVQVKDKFGYIDKNNSYIAKPMFEFALDYNENLACVKYENGIGYMDVEGNMTIEPRFSNGSSFSDGLAPVEFDYKWGFINKKGEFVIKCKYQLTYPFVDGVGIVWEEDNPSYINRNGIIIRSVFEEE